MVLTRSSFKMRVMTTNDYLRSLRYLLNVGDGILVEILGLAGCQVSQSDVVAFLKKEEDVGYQECPHKVMAHFLDGMVIYRRGQDKTRPPQTPVVPVTNNVVLKKVRVAFELKDSDIIGLIETNGLLVSKAELNAFFRRPDHRNYRECGDQFLRNLFKGLGTQGRRPSS